MRVQRPSARVALAGGPVSLRFGWAGSRMVCAQELLEGRHTVTTGWAAPWKALGRCKDQQGEARGGRRASPWRSRWGTAGRCGFASQPGSGWQEVSQPHVTSVEGPQQATRCGTQGQVRAQHRAGMTKREVNGGAERGLDRDVHRRARPRLLGAFQLLGTHR